MSSRNESHGWDSERFNAILSEFFSKHPEIETSNRAVTQLEWHCEPRPQDYSLTSHSWLVMFLSDGTAVKLEFLGDYPRNGYVKKTMLPNTECFPSRLRTKGRNLSFTGLSSHRSATLYDSRVAVEFTQELCPNSLETVCRHFAAERYSTVQYNCHHWCMAVWNDVVPISLREYTYPDQWKCEAAARLGLATFFNPISGGITGAEGGVLPTLLASFRYTGLLDRVGAKEAGEVVEMLRAGVDNVKSVNVDFDAGLLDQVDAKEAVEVVGMLISGVDNVETVDVKKVEIVEAKTLDYWI